MTGLWGGFNERMQRILTARHSIHATITSSMPDGIMGRDFARNFLKVPSPLSPNSLHYGALQTLSSPNGKDLIDVLYDPWCLASLTPVLAPGQV